MNAERPIEAERKAINSFGLQRKPVYHIYIYYHPIGMAIPPYHVPTHRARRDM